MGRWLSAAKPIGSRKMCSAVPLDASPILGCGDQTHHSTIIAAATTSMGLAGSTHRCATHYYADL